MRILIWFGLLGALYWALRKLIGSGTPASKGQKVEGEEMVCDPHCGVYVPLSSALKRRVRGKTVYFCSNECEVSYSKDQRI